MEHQANTKVCRKCGVEKLVTEFWVSDKKRGYRRANCKDCDKLTAREYYAANPEYQERMRAGAKRFREENPELYEYRRLKWRHQIKQKYKITPEQYFKMVEAQGDSCALCGSSEIGRTGKNGKWSAGRWNIDHCHKTGTVRGLLCHTCNVRIGAYEKLLAQVGEEKVKLYLSAP